MAAQVGRVILLAGRALRAKFDSAANTAENRRHWANADGLSADAAASPDVRRILRNRARYETANNSLAKGIVLTLANDVVGTGPRLQMLAEDADVNQKIEREFMRWARAVGLPAKLRTMRMARATDGEAFAVFARNPKLASPVKLDLKLIEADQVTTPDLLLGFDRHGASILSGQVTDGIVFDEFGNPVVYHVLREHPGSTQSFALIGLKYDSVPAEQVIHYFRVDRPGQHRGVPDLMPALPLFAQLRRYTLATIAAAETAADFAGVLQTDAPPEDEPDAQKEADKWDGLELNPRTLTTLPGGWSLNQLKAEQPATTYREFKREILNEIARCLNMPFNIAAADSSSYNYASGRMDHQTYFKNILVEQDDLEAVVLDRIFAAWFSIAVLLEDYLPPAARTLTFDPAHQWFWDGYEHVDPTKEASAEDIGLKNHTLTYAEVYGKKGLDWEVQLRQRARETKLMNELGLASPSPAPVAVREKDDEEVTQDK
jgi:lambda family phage portal protein